MRRPVREKSPTSSLRRSRTTRSDSVALCADTWGEVDEWRRCSTTCASTPRTRGPAPPATTRSPRLTSRRSSTARCARRGPASSASGRPGASSSSTSTTAGTATMASPFTRLRTCTCVAIAGRNDCTRARWTRPTPRIPSATCLTGPAQRARSARSGSAGRQTSRSFNRRQRGLRGARARARALVNKASRSHWHTPELEQAGLPHPF